MELLWEDEDFAELEVPYDLSVDAEMLSSTMSRPTYRCPHSRAFGVDL
jgi:hypothetical protein